MSYKIRETKTGRDGVRRTRVITVPPRPLMLYVEPEVYRFLAGCAHDLGRPVSSFVRDWIQNSFEGIKVFVDNVRKGQPLISGYTVEQLWGEEREQRYPTLREMGLHRHGSKAWLEDQNRDREQLRKQRRKKTTTS